VNGSKTHSHIHPGDKLRDVGFDDFPSHYVEWKSMTLEAQPGEYAKGIACEMSSKRAFKPVPQASLAFQIVGVLSELQPGHWLNDENMAYAIVGREHKSLGNKPNGDQLERDASDMKKKLQAAARKDRAETYGRFTAANPLKPGAGPYRMPPIPGIEGYISRKLGEIWPAPINQRFAKTLRLQRRMLGP
jgi:hypothetical protein